MILSVFPGVGAQIAIFGKNLNHEHVIPIAPYVCLAYGSYEDRWFPLAGV